MCSLAAMNGPVETRKLPGHLLGFDTNCVPYEAFLPNGGAAISSKRRGHWVGGNCYFGHLGPDEQRGLGDRLRWRSDHGPADSPPANGRRPRPLASSDTPARARPHFVASEGPLPDLLALDSPGLALVTMLRDPLDRTLSAHKWFRSLNRQVAESMRVRATWGGDPPVVTPCNGYDAPRNASLMEWLARHPDNFMTRSLAGRGALLGDPPPAAVGRGGAPPPPVRPPPSLTEADYQLAVSRLGVFAVVLLTEEYEKSAGVMARIFGWRVPELDQVRAGSRWGTDARRELQDRPEELAALVAANTYDLRLYAHARDVFRAQLAAAGDGVGEVDAPA